MKNKLAILGGPKLINKTFERYNTIGKEEISSVNKVMRSGILSQFIGDWDPDFYGGKFVKNFERNCEEYFNVKHAITVNSWTSGLIVALGAIGIEPGDEVIVSPWTMAASATAILHWNAIPVFADIENDTFNLCPNSILKNITNQTKAIVVVDIFGHSAMMDEIMAIAKKFNIKVISDTAQSIGALYKLKYAGTLSHIGGYSLNYHKHIHTGEGGILVTNDKELAERMQLIRNHAEAVVGNKGVSNLTNMVGYNFRLGEIEAAIGIEQLKKLKNLVASRQRAGNMLTSSLKGLDGLSLPKTLENCTHSFYAYSMQLDIQKIGVSRDTLHSALTAEGLRLSKKYQNIHLLPIFQKKIAYGSKGFPWNSEFTKRNVNYSKGICPVAEKLQDETFISIGMCFTKMSNEEVTLIGDCFKKVWDNLDALRSLSK